MSRLESHRQKQFMKKIIFFVVCLLALVILIATLGFNALINSSLFVSNMFSKGNSDQNQHEDNFFGTLYLDSIPTATNSARIIVSGSASNFDTVEYYINDDKVKSISVTDIPSFSDEIGSLKKGVNNVYLKAIAKTANKEKKSEVYNVVYSDDKPKLEISDPKDNTKTSKSEIQISGETNKDIEIKVNQLPVIVDTQGKFQTTVRLKEGENKIDIVAMDEAGNTEKKTLTITYQKDD